jgi:hypothetical protein
MKKITFAAIAVVVVGFLGLCWPWRRGMLWVGGSSSHPSREMGEKNERNNGNK